MLFFSFYSLTLQDSFLYHFFFVWKKFYSHSLRIGILVTILLVVLYLSEYFAFIPRGQSLDIEFVVDNFFLSALEKMCYLGLHNSTYTSGAPTGSFWWCLRGHKEFPSPWHCVFLSGRKSLQPQDIKRLFGPGTSCSEIPLLVSLNYLLSLERGAAGKGSTTPGQLFRLSSWSIFLHSDAGLIWYCW